MKGILAKKILLRKLFHWETSVSIIIIIIIIIIIVTDLFIVDNLR